MPEDKEIKKPRTRTRKKKSDDIMPAPGEITGSEQSADEVKPAEEIKEKKPRKPRKSKKMEETRIDENISDTNLVAVDKELNPEEEISEEQIQEDVLEELVSGSRTEAIEETLESILFGGEPEEEITEEQASDIITAYEEPAEEILEEPIQEEQAQDEQVSDSGTEAIEETLESILFGGEPEEEIMEEQDTDIITEDEEPAEEILETQIQEELLQEEPIQEEQVSDSGAEAIEETLESILFGGEPEEEIAEEQDTDIITADEEPAEEILEEPVQEEQVQEEQVSDSGTEAIEETLESILFGGEPEEEIMEEQASDIITADEEAAEGEENEQEATDAPLMQELIDNHAKGASEVSELSARQGIASTKILDTFESSDEMLLDKDIENLMNEDISIDTNIKKQFDLIDEPEEDLAELVRQLTEEADSIELLDLDTTLINDIEVFDTVDRRQDIVDKIAEQIGEETDKESKEMTTFYIIIASLILVTIVSGIFLFSQIMRYQDIKRQKEEITAPTVLDSPDNEFNTANFIYITETVEFDERELKLTKVLLDSVVTAIYFDSYIDTRKYNITLSDIKGNIYPMDLSFVQHAEPDDKKKETILRFEPISHAISSYTLTFNKPDTDETAKIDFKFSLPIKLSPAKYLKKPVRLEDTNGISVEISNAIFSSAGSRIDYKIKWSPDLPYMIQHGATENQQFIILEEVIRERIKTRKYPAIYSFDDGYTLLGRMDFKEFYILNSTANITFTDLYKKIPINNDIPVTEISSSGGDSSHSFTADNCKIFLEGFRRFGDNYVLVLHAENMDAKSEGEGNNSNRIEVQLNAQLIARTKTGMEVVLEGTAKSAQYGTDMVFPVNAYAKGFLENVENEALYLRINSALIKMDDISASINLATAASSEQNEDLRAPMTFVTTAFNERLAYKSGERKQEVLGGYFSNTVLSDDTLAYEYTPVEMSGKPLYSSQFVTASLIDENTMYGVVNEVWKGADNTRTIHFYRTHKIIVKRNSIGKWLITEDIIIK